MRRQSAVPIILLSETYTLEQLADSIQSGADDYLRRSLPLPILQARLQAILRRVSPVLPDERASLFANGELIVDAYRQSVTVRPNPWL